MGREELKDYKRNQEWIKDRFEYIEELESNIEKITTTLSDMPTGSRKVDDRMAEKIAILNDSINELMERIIIEDNKQKEILKQIEQVEQPYRLILEKVYILGKSLVTTASEMEYDYKHMCYKHGIALNRFDELDK